MILHNEYEQRSVEWMDARSGIPTASEFDALLTPEFKIRTGEMPFTYMYKKLAEWWQGGPLIGFNTFDMDQGNILEEECKPWFSLEYGRDIESVGFITTDDGKVGCSPDGLLRGMEDSGLELKCPEPQTHCKYLLNGTLPKEYAAQVHGSMFVTGFSKWIFVSYRRRYPALVLTVERDNGIQGSIQDALDQFLDRFEAGKKRLIELNGGPPKRRPVPTQPPPVCVDEVTP